MTDETIVLDQPWQMEMFKLLQCIHRLKIEIGTGLKFRQSTLAAANKYYGVRCRTKVAALEALEELQRKVEDRELHPMQLPIAKREVDVPAKDRAAFI